MKVIHRIGINPDEAQKAVLARIGIAVPISNGVMAFELEENSKEYQSLNLIWISGGVWMLLEYYLMMKK